MNQPCEKPVKNNCEKLMIFFCYLHRLAGAQWCLQRPRHHGCRLGGHFFGDEGRGHYGSHARDRILGVGLLIVFGENVHLYGVPRHHF
jgi:hypothetical protein